MNEISTNDTINPNLMCTTQSLHNRVEYLQQVKQQVLDEQNNLLIKASEIHNNIVNAKTNTKKVFYEQKFDIIKKSVVRATDAVQTVNNLIKKVNDAISLQTSSNQ